ncbi:hypothetical protein IKG24_01295 [Candidatus Saccharibacteria bacterium]|nr:hypothetical protein [Candidatus Saccharibacteria bacterium]
MRSLKHFISALGITLLVAVFCGIASSIGIGNNRAFAESSGGLLFNATMNGVTLDLTIPSSTVSLQLDPTASLEEASAKAFVTTDAPYGYTLMMTADSTNLTRTTPLQSGDYPIIPTLASDATSFTVNHWGWRLSADNKYYGFDNNGVQVGYSSEPVTNKEETIVFGAKADSSIPLGDYQLALTLTALANARPALTIYDMETMQAFNGITVDDRYSILDSMVEGESYTLKDSRDNQDYTIAKLFDGNIWMTKNLNLAGGTALYSDTSNVPDGYPSSGNNPYYTLPASSTSGFSNDSTAYVYNSGRTNCSSPGCYSYYSYPAATAGTNPNTDGVNATSDICPAGWRLPTKSEYETLIGTYNTGPKLTASPFLGVYAGNYYGSAFRFGGSYGYYWSSTASGSTTAHLMYFGGSDVAVSSGDGKRRGYSARCILQ